MGSLPFPDAPPNFLATYVAARRAGQEDRLSTARQNALAGAADNPDRASNDLMRLGDFQGAQAVDQYGTQQTQKRVLSQYQTDPAGARSAAFSAGDPKLVDMVSNLDVSQRAIAQQHAETIAAVGLKLKSIPDVGARKAALQAMTPSFVARGFKAEDISGFDPTDANIDAAIGQASSLKDLLAADAKQHEPFTLGQGQTRYGSDGQPVASVAPETKLFSAPAENNVYDVTGGQPAGAPRAVRNNNPLNLTNLPSGQWAGQTGQDGKFAVFSSPQAGLVAADKNLQSYATNHGAKTISDVVTRWAPAGENDTKGYIARVSSDLGVAPDAPINLADPGVRQKLLTSMAKVEIGGSPPAGPKLIQQGTEDAPLSPEAIDLLAGKFVSSGVMPTLGMGKAAAANRVQILNRASELAKSLGLDANDLVAGTASTKALGGALAKASTLRSQLEASEATLNKNLDYMLSLAPKGVGGTVPVFNRWIQAGRKAVVGDPQVTAFNNAVDTAAAESAALMTRATGAGSAATSDAAMREAHDRFDKAGTLQQLQAAAQVARIDGHNRVESYRAMETGLQAQLKAGPGGTAPAAAPAPTAPAAVAPGAKAPAQPHQWPTNSALDYLAAHPETQAAFEARFGPATQYRRVR